MTVKIWRCTLCSDERPCILKFDATETEDATPKRCPFNDPDTSLWERI